MRENEYNLWQRFLQARNELISFYLPLAEFWAKKISANTGWVSQDDLMQSGVEGIVKAISGFDLDRGLEFGTYARDYIRGAMFKCPELTRDVKQTQYQTYRKAMAAHDKLMERLMRKPTIKEIAREAKISVKQVENAFSAMSICFADALPGEDSQQPVTNPIARVENKILIQEVQKAFSHLKEREALILTYCYWEDLSDAEIAERIELTPDNVKKIRQRALDKLRKLLNA